MSRIVRSIVLVAVAAAVLATGTPAGAQGITQQQADQILEELRAIRQLLERQAGPPAPPPPSPRVALPPATVYVLGRDDAPLTLVEFTDLECPFCRQFHVTTFEQLKRNYIDTGKLRFVTRDYPLDFHANARPAALAARCAGEQNKFWEMRHVLTVNAATLSGEAMQGFARALGLDMNRFGACMSTEKYRAAIDRDIADAQNAEVSGTPTFVLGKTAPQGFEGLRIVGAQPYAVFEQKIRELLGEGK
ncbi:MAG TPA: thioredoxin domain-containing protein [Methylomirabilota bacterium]|nr:thioredoxin domain-containing protein [Methylomirabilota bacterium]